MSAIGAVKQIFAAPSSAADGLTDAEYTGAPAIPPSGFFSDMFNAVKKGHLAADLETVLQGLNEFSHPLDDRKLLLEHGVSMLQSLPPGSAIGKKAGETLITKLWNDLPHPLVSTVGSKYRTADGSGNNPMLPEMGKAGCEYARSVPPVTPKPTNLPDPSLVFDLLLRRDETKFKPHPSGLSQTFFAYATIVIHECFATNRKDWSVNDTSSYVDLSTLYGNNQAEQDGVRTRNGKGTILNDSVASSRIKLMTPTVLAVLLIFSRNHNTIASKLLAFNERGKYSVGEEDLAALDDAARAKQDEDIFQLARNINVGWFAHVVLADYVAAILNTHRADSNWLLDLGAEIKNADGSRFPRGGGNTVSVEFNILYRWHASLSAHDAAWITDKMEAMHPDHDSATITPAELAEVGMKLAKENKDEDPKRWTFGGLTRDADDKFDDVALAEILKNATEEPAHAFGANGSPPALKVVEVIGQLMAREWQVCTMNEFRTYLNLKPFKSFTDWNSDPAVAAAASTLYGGRIDDLELYPGLLAEQAKPAMSGSGVAPGHTIGRAILDDAVSLIRSDRFLTNDFNISTLTSWGIASIKPAPGCFGGYLPALLFTHLPGAYEFNSVYAVLPFYTPTAAAQILKDNGVLSQYSVKRTRSNNFLHSIQSFAACKAAFQDRATFQTFYNEAITQISPAGFLIGFDEESKHDPPRMILAKAFYPPGSADATKKFFKEKTDLQIMKKSLAFANSKVRQIDIARDVCNIVPIMWIADRFGLPIKNSVTPHGLVTIQELRLMLFGLFIFCSFSIIPKAGWQLRETSLKSAGILTGLIKTRISTASGLKDAALNLLAKNTAFEKSPESEALYRDLQATGVDPTKLAGDIIGLMIPLAGNITQQLATLVDLYLQPQYAAEKEILWKLSREDTPEGDALILGYIREGMRIAPVVIGLPRNVAVDTVVQDGDRTVNLKAGDKVIIGISKAHMDPVAFPNPTKIDPTREKDAYIILGYGLHNCIGGAFAMDSMLASIKSIFKLNNLRRVPGRAGKFVRATENLGGLDGHVYLDEANNETFAPVSLQILYDADTIEQATGSPAVNGLPPTAVY